MMCITGTANSIKCSGLGWSNLAGLRNRKKPQSKQEENGTRWGWRGKLELDLVGSHRLKGGVWVLEGQWESIKVLSRGAACYNWYF